MPLRAPHLLDQLSQLLLGQAFPPERPEDQRQLGEDLLIFQEIIGQPPFGSSSGSAMTTILGGIVALRRSVPKHLLQGLDVRIYLRVPLRDAPFTAHGAPVADRQERE